MKNLITIGLPSKGRLKDKAIVFLNDRGLRVLNSDRERNYFASMMVNVGDADAMISGYSRAYPIVIKPVLENECVF